MTVATLQRALLNRRSLLDQLHGEGTDCYRLFHGAVEGFPGCTIDRYGGVLLVQTWREPLKAESLHLIASEIEQALGFPLQMVWNHRAPSRGGGRQAFDEWHDPGPLSTCIGTELGIAYDVRPRHQGADPLLFLDFRPGRRRIRQAAAQTVLNLFAYTCGAGIVSAVAGAREVWNVDFSSGALNTGACNAELNGIAVGDRFRLIREDVFAVVRQCAGLPIGGRRSRRRRRPLTLPQRSFDLVVLDPPRWAKSAFGTVDIVRDYASLFKPAAMAASPGGAVLATNNVAAVDRRDWITTMVRCAEKAGRPVRSVEILAPERDFPCPDGRPATKMAWFIID